jgi:hypothetical protein
MSAVVDDGCIGGAYQEHLNGGDKTLVMLHAEVRNREILSETFPVVAPGVFGNNVGVVVFDGEEKLRCLELRFVVVVCLNLGGAD